MGKKMMHFFLLRQKNQAFLLQLEGIFDSIPIVTD